MRYRDRNGNEVTGNEKQDMILRLLYSTVAGRMLMKPLVQPAVSRICGHLLNTRLSAYVAKAVIRRHRDALADCKEQNFASYNAFFHRELLPGSRPIASGEGVLISPCDGKLICCPVTEKSRFVIKHSTYSLQSLLRSERIAERFSGGTLLIFRLTVDDYHRYCYIADGKKSKNVRIPGVFHTVNPSAVGRIPVYKENTREFSLLKTQEFGTVLMVEAGAMLVGKIHNHHEEAWVRKGMEKGYFEFGGSTIILCFEKDRIIMDDDIVRNSKEKTETLVRRGERIGISSAQRGHAFYSHT